MPLSSFLPRVLAEIAQVLPLATMSSTEELTPDVSADQAFVRRQSEPWLEDGNIALEAGAKQFRVHKSILAKHSTVFRDMFTLPRAKSGLEPLDDSRVALSDDPDILQDVLASLYGKL